MVEGVIYFFFLWNLFLKSNLSWLVLNDANRRRSTIHWIRCITFKMSQCSIINHLCSNSYQICSLCTLFFWRPPEAASNAALSTYPYWRFLTHSAWSGRTRYFLLSLANKMITLDHTYIQCVLLVLPNRILTFNHDAQLPWGRHSWSQVPWLLNSSLKSPGSHSRQTY